MIVLTRFGHGYLMRPRPGAPGNRIRPAQPCYDPAVGRSFLALSLVVGMSGQAPPPENAARMLEPARLESLALDEIRAARYAEAVRHATDAAALYSRLNDRRRSGAALNLAGRAWMYAGDYAAAARALESAIEHSTAAGDAAGQAEQVSNLGNVHFFVGRYADAAAAYDSALALCDRHRDEPWAARRRRLVQVNRATLYQRLGRDEQALEIYRALGPASADLPANEQAQVLANLGVLYRHLGDPLKALTAYDAARALFSRDRLIDGELGVMKNRGIALALDLGELDAAMRVFSEALDTATAAGNRREMLQAQLYRAEAGRRAGLEGAARRDFAASLDLARALGTREEEWKALYGLGRVDTAAGRRESAAAHFEQALAVIEGIRESVRIPSLRSDFFSDKREVYDALIAARVGSATPDRLFELIERSHSRAWRERLGLPGAVPLAAVQRALGDGVVLLDLWHAPAGSAAVLVTRDRAQVIPLTPDAKAIGQLLLGLSAGPSPDWRARAAAVGRTMPFEIPPGTRHVIVVPDGAFALVPFELLPVGGRLLVEQASVSYVPTAALLLGRPGTAPGFVAPWRVQLRAFGDPAFASAPLDDPARVRTGTAASGGEVRAIAAEIAGAAVLHTGADNRKAYLYEGGPLPPLLHIATHAVADPDALEQSRILFSPARDGSGGADYLFLKEAYDLKLAGVELAVLSACETERGRVLRGEGVQSFSRAFLAAGARSTVTTLWRVPDVPTATFMTVFYHHLQRGEPRAEALRLAKVRFLESSSTLSDPHYWAAFVLTGEGRQPIPRTARWTAIAASIAAGIVVIGLAAAASRRRSASR